MNLSDSQKEAVEHIGGPLLVTAGAGSGKTRTLTERVIHLIKKGASPESILAITFTNKAANEMRERIIGGLPKIKGARLPHISTFHSFCASILRREARAIGRTSDFTIFDSSDSLRVIKKIIKSFNFSEKEVESPGKVSKEISNIKNVFGKDGLETPLREIYEAYDEELTRQNALDFDDLILKTIELFQRNPEKLKKYQTKFTHVLVDEYQDINPSQYLLIKLLCEKQGNLSVVGDDQQSIYAFRGASIRTFLDFERDWPSAKVVRLGENYRSSANIVRAAAGVISNNKLQLQKELWTKNTEGSLIRVGGLPTAEAEGEIIVSLISAENYRESAILYRTNAQSRAIEQALNFASIPYEMYGGVKFYDRKEVKDIIAPLRFALNPKDEVSKERIEKTFLKKPREELISSLPTLAKELSLMELIGFVLKTTSYFEVLPKKYENAEERIENVRELISFASEFSSLAEFMERVSLLGANDNINRIGENGAPVKLMTIHLAKGLEFEDVYIAGATEGLLPHHRSYFREEDIEEERRLMYVAMTRAKEGLTITFHGVASRFLYEIPPEFVSILNPEDSFGERTIYLE